MAEMTEERKKMLDEWLEESRDTSKLEPFTDEEAERLIAKSDKLGSLCGGEPFDEFTHNEIKKVLQGKSTWDECDKAVIQHIDETCIDEDPDVSDEDLNNFVTMHPERSFVVVAEETE